MKKSLVSMMIVLALLVMSCSLVSAAVVFSDNFEDGNATGWTVQYGTWSVITDGSYCYSKAGTDEGRSSAGSTWTNASFEAKVKITNFNGSNRAIVCGRYLDGNNYYGAQLKSGAVEIVKKVGGSSSTLITKAYTISLNTWYTVKLTISGTSLTLYVNGAQQLTATDSSLASGKVGLVPFKVTANYDDVVVDDLAGGGSTPTPTPVATPTNTTTPVGVTPTNTNTPTPSIVATPTATITPSGGGGSTPMVGFATLNGGTTGGQGGPSSTVNTGTALQAAINLGGPRIIYVNGTINLGNSSGLSKIDIKDVADISIIGVGTSANIDGIGIKCMRTSNVILRNLKVHNVLSGDKDCISIEGPVNNVWVDHNELYNEIDGVDKDYYDALLDAKADSAYLTYSWNKLHDSWKASLCGSSESDTYDRRATIHHNSFIKINSRLPLYRGGQGHVYNNHYSTVLTSGVNSRINATLRVEQNYFDTVNEPICSIDSDIIGYWHVAGNIFVNCTGSQPTTSTCTYNPPYSYTLDAAANVPSIVAANAGVGKI